MEVLQLKNVTLTINDNHILHNINIDFWNGYVHAVSGPNGAGKSTLASTIMGLEGYREIQGDIIYQGENINDRSVDERARLGITMAWQDPARYEGLTIKDFLMASAKIKNEDNIRDVLASLSMNPQQYLKRALDKTLSGGERKKIELASILVNEARLVLLDEPDSGIDVESLERIFESIRLLKKRGTTVILITHSLAVLQQADHAFLMCSGEIIDKGEKEKIVKYFENKCIPCPHKNIPDEWEPAVGK
ncbi:MAG: ABC transporter ATP-binding protein [Spirochaetales bacterium]|nr:ABC transporter ATP-binding protein [Spirochaetales bacterium]